MNLDNVVHLSGSEILSIHDSILEDHEGLKGSRPDLSVEALVGRIHTNLVYQSDQFPTLESIGALYAEVIAKGHVFNDANKRTALLCMVTFLELNGLTFDVDNIQLADKIVDLAEGKINHRLLASWLKPYSRSV